MNPGDLITEYSQIPDAISTYNKLGIILERRGEFPHWFYKALMQDGSVKEYSMGTIRRLRIHESR